MRSEQQDSHHSIMQELGLEVRATDSDPDGGMYLVAYF